jgi:hypothetical protein
MKPKDIKVGHTYANRGAGSTKRTVLEIGAIECRWLGAGFPPANELVVRYDQNGEEGRLYLCSFAAWCGNEVTA